MHESAMVRTAYLSRGRMPRVNLKHAACSAHPCVLPLQTATTAVTYSWEQVFSLHNMTDEQTPFTVFAFSAGP